VSADESEAAKEDLWLTYQNYDPAVKQAVRRLGALPGNNVEEFRTLLLASRERKRAKEFEADVVRRLQGEAFVDDEVLQQTLIVLHAENPGLAEEFKKFVAANGRPDDIDLTVARLRSGTDDPVMLERMPRNINGRVFDVHPDVVTSNFIECCRRAGIEGLRLHDLRAEAVSRLFEKGLDVNSVKSISGHKSAIFMRYMRSGDTEALAQRLA